MTTIRVIYPFQYGDKLMRIYEVLPTENLAVPKTCTKMMPDDWDASVIAMGGIEEDYIAALEITLVQDMR